MSRPARIRPRSVAYCKGMIKLIHVAKSKLALDDETYRDMLQEITGKTSSKDLEAWELERVLAHLESRGFVRTAGPAACKLADDPQSKLIRHLWLKLHGMGEVRNPSESALNAFVRNMTGRDHLEWINTTQASNVIEALKAWVKRAGGEV